MEVAEINAGVQATKAIVKRVSPISGTAPPEGWKPGQSGNPRGRPCMGLSILEWINQFAEWRESEIRTAAKDKAAPSAKRIAAKRVVAALSDAKNASGNLVGGPEFDRILDRTVGKAIQREQVMHFGTGHLDPSRLTQDQLNTFTELMRLMLNDASQASPEIAVTTLDK